ncbi:MAG: hypothetical protein NTZ49_05065 [Candidatus Parcubacteria bacterium]|nr:hypothetical protein [Candidatus Parcubacteria bacterium]
MAVGFFVERFEALFSNILQQMLPVDAKGLIRNEPFGHPNNHFRTSEVFSQMLQMHIYAVDFVAANRLRELLSFRIQVFENSGDLIIHHELGRYHFRLPPFYFFGWLLR